MAQQNKSNSLTEGSVARGMLLFAIPIFISNLFQQLYNAADSLIVGNFLGGEALAAVGSSGSLIFLLTGFVNGVALGAGVLIARYFGAKDWESLEKAIHTTVALGLAAGAVLTVVGVILTPQILHWMGTPEDVLGHAVTYINIYFLGMIPSLIYNIGSGILRAVGARGSDVFGIFFNENLCNFYEIFCCFVESNSIHHPPPLLSCKLYYC